MHADLPGLMSAFERPNFFQPTSYRLLPFRFLPIDPDRVVITNLAGDFRIVSRPTLNALVCGELAESDSEYQDLEAMHVLQSPTGDSHFELLAAQIRTRLSRLPDLAALHLFVVTLRCDHSCAYCQVSRVSEDRVAFDMSDATADRAVDLMLESPSPQLKIEFQGGEPLLNFPLIKRIVQRSRKRGSDRSLAFVIATNLSGLNDEILAFCRDNDVKISTSIDGPSSLHNRNRPRPGHDAYERTVSGINRCRDVLGHDAVSALMTCTAESLTQPERIIDEYVKLGFREIFLRHISPYGFAVRSESRLGYETEQFLEFYRRGLSYIIALNKQGIPLREVYSALLLRRMLTVFPTGYVDLQSPTGAGLGALVYNYDGKVYASDEGRMLAEMGDNTFCLGTVGNSWTEIFTSTRFLDVVYQTMNEGIPGCSECAFQSWCGSDPVFHHSTQRDVVGHRPTSAFCRRNMEIMRHLVRLLADDLHAGRILRRWAT